MPQQSLNFFRRTNVTHNEIKPSENFNVRSTADIPSAPVGSSHRVRHERPLESDGPIKLSSEQTLSILNASFTSVSSASSVPPSTNSSSRRVMTNGLFAVTNSESDSDGQSENDSTDGLADVESFMPRKPALITPPYEKRAARDVDEDGHQPLRKSSRLSFQRAVAANRSDYETPLLPTPKRYKYSLQSMIKQHKNSEVAGAKIAAMEAEIQREQDQRNSRMSEPASTAKSVAAVVADDSEDGGRVLMALERTEAFTRGECFHLFNDGDPRVMRNEPFPSHAVAKRPFGSILAREITRVHACSSGLVTELAARGDIPHEVVQWLQSQLVFESDDSTRGSYTEIIRACIDRGHFIDAQLSSLAGFYSLNSDLVLQPMGTQDLHPFGLLGFENVVHIVQICASCGSDEVRDRAFVDLALANVDYTVERNTGYSSAVRVALAEIADSIPGGGDQDRFHRIRRHIFDSGTLPQNLICKLISHLPCTTMQSHSLRRHLALYAVTEDAVYRPNSSSDWVAIIRKALTNSPKFAIHDSTDYRQLAHLAGVLDVAIDSGLSPGDFPWVQSSDGDVRGRSGQRPIVSSEERLFNEQTDTLIECVKAIKLRIKEAGATHLHRLEARSALERIEMRLEYGVRSRPRPRKGVFGTVSDDDVHERRFMQHYFGGDNVGHTR